MLAAGAGDRDRAGVAGGGGDAGLGPPSYSVVMLNLFQHPCAITRARSVARAATERAWILKQVQDDG